MKILYAIQATGNGHISRARQLLPYLEKIGHVDTILSGANATLDIGLPVTYRSNGVSLFYRECGGLNYTRMFHKNNLLKAYKDAKKLPVKKYDLIINDFDAVTAMACRIHKKSSIQFGHQASFLSTNTPRPDKKSFMGEFVLKNYAVATDYVGLHFLPYDKFIFPPVIKKSIIESNPSDKGHITVYLPSYDKTCLEEHFKALPDIHFDWFTHDVKVKKRMGNITFNPISNDGFTQSLIHCHGIITGGGFETPAEALYLQKRLMSIPIRDHYEQKCNAAALKKIGVYTLKDIDNEQWTQQIKQWMDAPKLEYQQKANNIEKTLEYVLSKAS